MSGTSKTDVNVAERYNAPFAKRIREYMASHPDTGEKTTQAELGKYLKVRPQTVSCYCTGESLPDCNRIVQIAKYFKISCDLLLTGRRVENEPVREMLGLSERTVQNMKLVNEGYFKDSPNLLAILDCMLGDKDFYLAMVKAAEYEELKTKEDTDDYKQFLEWKAAGYMQSYFLDFFAKNLQGIYKTMKGDDEK